MTTRCLKISLALLLAAPAAWAADPWTHYTKEDTPNLPGNEVQFIGPAKAGGIWLGTLEGAAQVLNGAFSPLKGEKGSVLKLSMWCVLETADRTWLGHQQGALELRDGKQRDALAGYTVAPILEIKPGVLWALGKNTGTDAATLFECRENAWKPVEAFAKRRLTNVYQTKNGRLWVTVDGNGVLEIDPDAGPDKAVHHLQSMNVTSLIQDSKGVIWCGLWANGVAWWDGTAWKRELPKTKRSAVLAIVEDAKANLWAATSADGLWRRATGKTDWANDLADEGGISLLVATSDGRVWVSSQSTGGLRYWSGDAWVVSLDSPLPIRALVETADGALWAGGVLDGLYVLKKGK